jgi:hypothetical protein
MPVRGDAVPSPGERREAIARLLEWADAHGARWDGIEFVVDAAGGASVRAVCAIAVGERVLALPRRLMIADDRLADSATGDPGLANARDTLAAWLPLEVREPASRWRAYLAALPVQLPDLPMFRDASDLRALGTAARALAEEGRRDLLRAYGELPPALRERVSLADFAWGWAIVRSRGYHATGTFQRLALLPLIDLFDHRPGDTTWTYDPFDALFEITAERAFSPGEAVHMSYGELDHSELLVRYGFTLP